MYIAHTPHKNRHLIHDPREDPVQSLTYIEKGSVLPRTK